MNKKTIKITSEENKESIIQSLNNIRRECGDRELITTLTGICDSLSQQKASTFEACLDKDDSIVSIIEDIKKDIKNNSQDVVKLRVDIITSLIEERAKLCPRLMVGLTKQQIKNRKIAEKANFKRAKEREKRIKKGLSIASTYSEDELFDIIKLQAKQDCAKYRKEANELRERMINDKNDQDAKESFEIVELKYNGARQRLEMLNSELYRNTLVSEVKKFNNTQKELIAKRTVSDDEFDVMMNGFAKAKEKVAADIIKTKDAGKKFNQGTATNNSEPAQDEAAITKASPQVKVADNFRNSSLMQELGGMPDENEIALKGVLENIESIIAILKNSSVQFEKDKLKYDADIEDYEDKLLALKPEYENANASKSKSVADEIKSVNTFRVANIRNRDRIIRAKDQLNKQLEMAINLKGIKDIEAAKKRASEIMGQKFNFEDWAMFIKKYDKDENVRLDDLETIIDVSKSENINETSLPETDLPYHSDITKNEHLFDALWEEIEKRRKGGADEA